MTPVTPTTKPAQGASDVGNAGRQTAASSPHESRACEGVTAGQPGGHLAAQGRALLAALAALGLLDGSDEERGRA